MAKPAPDDEPRRRGRPPKSPRPDPDAPDTPREPIPVWRTKEVPWYAYELRTPRADIRCAFDRIDSAWYDLGLRMADWPADAVLWGLRVGMVMAKTEAEALAAVKAGAWVTMLRKLEDIVEHEERRKAAARAAAPPSPPPSGDTHA